jgi:hypothetical protein
MQNSSELKLRNNPLLICFPFLLSLSQKAGSSRMAAPGDRPPGPEPDFETF